MSRPVSGRGSASIFTTLIIAFLLLVLPAESAFGFGKNKVNYKNFKWSVLETPHFEIHFYEGEEHLAGETSIILEHGYQVLARNLRHTLPWKVPVILYASQNDFQQTNVSPGLIPEGVAAFAEPGKKRIVLPYMGSHADYVHTAIHELVHIFTFDMIYGGLLDSVFTRRYLFQIPLWFAEGLAEYYSTGWDNTADMYIRDATIHDYLAGIDRVAGFYVYKEGQAALNYIREKYGEEKILEIIDNMRMTRSMSSSLKRAIGLTESEFSKHYVKKMRQTYWPIYSDKAEANELGRALTDHVKTHSFYNVKPSISPDGQLIAFFGDRGGTVNIYLMSAIDGKIVRKLVTGYTSSKFESIAFFKSDIGWSPDGEMIAFVAKSGGRDRIFIQQVRDGKILQEIDPRFDGLRSPAFSYVSDELVFSGSRDGHTDLYVVDLANEQITQLTNNIDDELEPQWFPNQRKIVFSHYPRVTASFEFEGQGNSRRITDIDYLSLHNMSAEADHDIWAYDIETGKIEVLVATPGDDKSPSVLRDGRTLVFASDASGIDNLYRADLQNGEVVRFTDVVGGLFSPDVCLEEDRLAFAAFRQGGFDIFVVENFTYFASTEYEIPDEQNYARIRRVRGLEPEVGFGEESPLPGDIARLEDQGEGSGRASTPPSSAESSGGLISGFVGEDSILVGNIVRPPVRSNRKDPFTRDSTVLSFGGLDEEDFVNEASVKKYKLKFTPDYIGQGPGIFYSTGFGFALANQIALSDLLGNHRLMFSFNFIRSVEDSDFLVSYAYLKRRVDFGVGAFQFSNYLNARVSSVGEVFKDYRLFKERNYGFLGLISLPMSTFTRIDLELQAYISEIEFFDEVLSPIDSSTVILETSGADRRRLIQPSLSLVNDSVRWGYFGPVAGSRSIFSISKAVSMSDDDISRLTGLFDYRIYLPLFYRNSFAMQFLGAWSEGGPGNVDARRFFLGGPSTLRGYDYLEFEGRKIALAKFEYRFPLIDALVFGWPGRWGLGNIGGNVFWDMGAAWDEDIPNAFVDDTNGLRFDEVRANFGFGFSTWFAYFPMHFSFAWRTDLREVLGYQFHFYLGPQF